MKKDFGHILGASKRHKLTIANGPRSTLLER